VLERAGKRARLFVILTAIGIIAMFMLGLGGIDVVTTDKAAILASASERGVVSGESQVYICGMRINLR
jgi:hypothetical protein